jgi:hypothetical protein
VKTAKIEKALIAMVLTVTLMLTACSTAWIGEAEQIVEALIPAVANLVTLVTTLQGKSVTTTDLQMIQNAGAEAGADLQLMQSLINQYQKADATAQPGLLNQIQAAMNAVQTTLNGLLPALQIKDVATQAKITAVVGLLISEVESMEAIVPLVNPSASPAMMTMAVRQAKKQAPLTADEFVSSYNASMTAKTGNPQLDHATAGLRVHLHDKFARWASAGLLK